MTAIGNALADDLHVLAQACRILDMEGHGDLTQGHLTMRDPEGRGVWMKRRGISLAQVRGIDDLVLISWEGEKIAGPGDMHIEWPIHTEIMLARPDVNAVGHTHPFHASLFSATHETLVPVIQGGARVLGGRVARYEKRTDLIDTRELGRELAESLGAAWAVFMRNHGLTFCGPDVRAAALNAIYIEAACKAQLAIAATGLAWDAPGEADMVKKAEARRKIGWLDTAAWDFFTDKLVHHESTGG